LHSTGLARYFDAAFMLLWLVFWVAGEVVAMVLVGALCASAISAALGRPLALASRVAPTDGSVTIFLLFLLFWLSLWTLGGFAAITHLLRRLAGRDSITIVGDGLLLTRRAGPFERRRRIALTSILRVRLRSFSQEVVLDTREGTVAVSDLGTADERLAVHRWLALSLVLPDAEESRRREREISPSGRDVETRGFSTIVSYPTRRARIILARVSWAIVAIASLGWIGALRRSAESVTTGELAAAGLTLLVAAGALWLTGARTEWILAPGEFRIRRSFFSRTVRAASFHPPASLKVEHYRDSDGDDRYTLVVQDGNRRRVLASALNDPYELGALAEWVAARTGFALDRTSVP
jgi:hypothetical protein